MGNDAAAAHRKGPAVFAHDDKMSVDSLFLHPTGKAHATLYARYQRAVKDGTLHQVLPDFHRLQLEAWLAEAVPKHMSHIDHRALDFGVIQRRPWQDSRYQTAGISGSEDLRIDLMWGGHAWTRVVNEWPEGASPSSYRAIVCSEVLEHVKNPFIAMETLRHLLARDGKLFLTSPFLWPDHATEDYPDFWRFTRGAWHLLADHAGLKVTRIEPILWSFDGGRLYEILRRIEGWGFGSMVEGHTGYIVEMEHGS